jgi:hypothetical protein
MNPFVTIVVVLGAAVLCLIALAIYILTKKD